jgi:hypothetical protein
MGLEKTITSLAVLRANWEINRQDYIENFVPLFVNLIYKKGYETISVDAIRKDFQEEYGLSLPHFATFTILIRVKNRGYIKKIEFGDGFIPLYEKITSINFTDIIASQERQFNQIINEFINFCETKYNHKVTKEVAESDFFSFLRSNSLETTLEDGEGKVLPDTDISKVGKFLVGQFIKDVKKNNDLIFKYIVSINIGQILANAILFDELSTYSSKLKGCNYYLDIGFIFSLLGIDGEEKRLVFEELIDDLKGARVNLFIFQHTYDECINILHSAASILRDNNINIEKAGKALRQFIVSGKSYSDVELIISIAKRSLENYGIEILDRPSPTIEQKRYVIDESRLYELINEIYRARIHHFVEERDNKELTIQRDVDSISSIYLLRKGGRPFSFKEAKYLFVTSNYGLARACRIFERERNRDTQQPTIPACLNDIIVGTFLWLQSPAKVIKLNEKKIIAEAYAATHPDERLIRKYFEEIEKLKAQKILSEDDYYFLRTNCHALELLGEKTLGDFEKVTHKTPQDIMEDIKESVRVEEKSKYEEERKSYAKIREDLEITKEFAVSQQDHINLICEKGSGLISFTPFVVLSVAIFLGLFYSYDNFQEIVNYPPYIAFSILFSIAISFIGNMYLLNDWRQKFKKKIKSLLLNFFKPRFKE